MFWTLPLLSLLCSRWSERMSDTKAQISADNEWYVFQTLPYGEQPYRSAPTAWPLSADELTRTEAQAATSNPSALNNLGMSQGLACFTLLSNNPLVPGAIHFFGWAQRPVNYYKAYDCFCRAHKAGSVAAAINRAMCK
jgi:hypothetical protein